MKRYRKPDYDGHFDFYRCLKCNRMITHLEMEDRVPTGKVCPCGALKYSPINPTWKHFFLPRVWRFSLYRALGRA